MDFEKKEFYGIVAKAKKQMQITIDQDCNVADTKPDIEKMIQTRGMVKIQETEMMIDRVRMKGEFLFQGLYGTNDTATFLESLEYSLPFEEYVHIPQTEVNIPAIQGMLTYHLYHIAPEIQIPP